jgi:hypothetical protein
MKERMWKCKADDGFDHGFDDHMRKRDREG